ncbi:YvrJ family protein [Cellulosilyticum sp. I15G10I2]|nr:YvrJ family protein [Cellulosilyticum sp. I15G10I2]
MEELLVQVGNVGFPIVLSMYLLVRLEGKMEQLATSISKLTAVLEEKR